MIDNRNYIIAIALSIVVLFGWQYFIAGPRLDAERQRRLAEIQATQQATAPQGQGIIGQSVPGQVAPVVGLPGQPNAGPASPQAIASGGLTGFDRVTALAQSPRITIDTAAILGSIGLKGGRIDDLKLRGYRETVDKNSPNIILLSPQGSEHPYYAEFGWLPDVAAPVKVPTADTLWTQEGFGSLTEGTPVVLTWDNGEGLVFKRTIAVDQKYMFTVTDQVTASGGRAAKLMPYSGVRRVGTPTVSGFYILHEGLIGVFGDEGLKEIGYKQVADSREIKAAKVAGGWIGFVDKYWATALIPDSTVAMQPIFASQKSGLIDTYQTFMVGDAVTVADGLPTTATTRLFAGAKEVSTVDGYAAQYGISRFDRLIDWGWFYFLTKPLFHLIDWLYRFLGNFGLAILAVTVILKGVFFPLANKSYDSMSKMKKVQPEMKELQDRFKDDKMKQQQALMELYKREKINPLSGCLPILIQIPVFFALYKVLFVTIEMRQAPFYGWVLDLASPDPTSIFNLFGLLPFTPPHALMIGVWPLIMGVTMFVQMKLNPAPPDPTQKLLFDWMPLLFTFMLASFPAGLVIYWAWNNLLSILQQAYIMRKNGVKIELWDNIRGMLPKKAEKPSG